MSYQEISYKKHSNTYSSNDENDQALYRAWKNDASIDSWRHNRIINFLSPLIKSFNEASWLTVGDGRYGTEARHLKKINPTISTWSCDISIDLLQEAHQEGLIESYSLENAEKLSFKDDQFDFCLCKESYHHFPRAPIALYEMLRTCRQGVVLIEPEDQYSVDPSIPTSVLKFAFIGMKNSLKKILGKPFTKYEFEEIGNFVYSVSERELSKTMLGLGFRHMALLGFNDHYIPGCENETIESAPKMFKKIVRKIRFQDFLSRVGFKKHTNLVAVLFKNEPDGSLRKKMEEVGYRFVCLPKNPFSS